MGAKAKKRKQEIEAAKKPKAIPWEYVLQDGRVCREVKWFPSGEDEDGKTTFGKLRDPFMQVTLRRGETTVRLQCTTSKNKSKENTEEKLLRLRWPDRRIYATFKAANGRVYTDYGNWHDVPSDPETFYIGERFLERLVRMGVSVEMVDTIRGYFEL